MSKITQWFVSHPTLGQYLIKSLYIIVLVGAVLFARRFITRILSTEGKDPKRQTVYPIFREVLSFVIYFLAFAVFLEIIGIASTPIWTMVSALSVAIGFGAQQVMKDFFSGFLLLLEDQYKKGDLVQINGFMGTVQAVSLRTTEIRDGVDGSVHIISNGEIRTVSNLSKEFMQAVIDIPLPYDQDIDYILSLLNRLAKAFPKHASVLSPIEVLGVRNFDDYSVSVRITTKTKTGDNWLVERELRRYFKEGLKKEGIELSNRLTKLPGKTV